MAFSINSSVAAQELAQSLVGTGVTISNVTLTGNSAQAGTFTGGLSAGGNALNGATGIGFNSGVVLSTGVASDLAATQTGIPPSTDFGNPGDPGLDAATGAPTYDASILAFDFDPGNATSIYFNFVFGTGEYPASPTFNDGFEILVNGTNVALIPGDHSTVELSNFAVASNKAYFKEATAALTPSGDPDGFPLQDINVQIQSMSVPLQAVATVLPNQINHIKFAVADSGDGAVDSFVLVQGGSLSTAPVSTTPSPAAPTVVLGHDTGSSAVDGVTSDGSLSVTTAETGGTLQYSSDGGTSWIASFTATEGANTVQVRQVDSAGNAGTASAPLSFTLDTLAPAAPTVVLDNGRLGDNLTSVVTPSITGTAAAGDTVILYDGTTAVGSALVAANGTWSVTTSSLADGAHTLTAQETDPAGNRSVASAPLVVIIDTVAPTVSGVVLASGNETLGLGEVVAFALTMSKPTIVGGGTPTLTLSNGAAAIYDADHSTPNQLVFNYIVAAGDDTPALTIASVNTNGATLTDDAGNAADFSGFVNLPVGAVAVVTGYHPFATLLASDPDPNDTLTVQAAIQPNIVGAYTHLGMGHMAADGVTYTATGTAVQVNTALAEVLFSPEAGETSMTGLTTSISEQGQSSNCQLDNTGPLGSALTASAIGGVVRAGSGPDLLTANAAGNVLIGGAGNDILVGSELGSTLIGGTGSSTYFSLGGITTIVGGGSHDIIAALKGDVTTVTEAGGSSLVALSDGTSDLISQGEDSIVGGAGSAIIRATGDSTLFFQGAGPSVFIGGAGSSTVVGGLSGGSLIDGGTGGGMFGGGSAGNNVIIGGQQSSTIFGGGNGDALYAVGSSGTVIAAGSGNETLVGGGSSGNDLFFGGSGDDLVGMGAGSDAFFAGTGSSTVAAGVGHDLFAFSNGRAGGSETIIGFKTGTDHISLQGYGTDMAQTALRTASVTQATATTPAGTTLTLSDNTKIIFAGLDTIGQTVFG